jgi:hypothetical protein
MHVHVNSPWRLHSCNESNKGHGARLCCSISSYCFCCCLLLQQHCCCTSSGSPILKHHIHMLSYCSSGCRTVRRPAIGSSSLSTQHCTVVCRQRSTPYLFRGYPHLNCHGRHSSKQQHAASHGELLDGGITLAVESVGQRSNTQFVHLAP